jgi:hypothetical protein
MLAFHNFSDSRRALLLAGACSTALAICMLPATAFAQSTTDSQSTDATAQEPEPADTAPATDDVNEATQEGGEIVVTGLRRSIRDSIAIKRKERGVVEAVCVGVNRVG